MRAGIGGPEANSTADIWRRSAHWWQANTPLGAAAIGPAPELPLPADAAVGFAFPPAAAQRAQLPALLALAAYDRPAEVASDLLDGDIDRPDHPYLLVLPAERIQPWTRGRTAPGLRKALTAHGWSGLTVPEYLVLQRQSFDAHGDHRFDAYTGDEPGWSWLPASTNGPLVGMAYYNPGSGTVQIAACKTGSKNPRKGAHLGRVLTGP
ncbi:hypothetical protein [Nocardia harenae]|uniref:hypothetical protein n=1 Tax=Nocardia harenae TaxID=358707 RepID=UPI00082CC005|nr:hypothetical protein [Nocardia harenae]